MAKSESQGMQIALSIFAFLFVLATAGFIYFMSENSKNVQAMEEERTRASEAETNAQNMHKKVIALAQKLGVQDDLDEAQIEQNWTQSFLPMIENRFPYGNNATDTQGQALQSSTADMIAANAMSAIRGLTAEVRNLSREKEKLTQEVADLDTKFKELSASAKTQHDTAIADFQESTTQQVSVQSGLKEQLDEKATQIANMQNDLDAARQEARTAQTTLQAEQGQWQAERDEFDQQIADLTQKVREFSNESFTAPDGDIRHVDQTSRTVWINLGSEDNLRPQITFSVWSSQSAGIARTNQARKGAIEVMRIDGPHSAECRITQQDLLDPILSGDLISTPLWRPNEVPHFALVGSLDIDGDLISDRERILQLIRANGGVLDAELVDGQMEGEMNVDTRFIIVGKSAAGQEQAVSNMLEEADKLGVQRMSLADFLERSGYRHSRETKSFGLGADPTDFDNVPINSNGFRPRRPGGGL